MTRNKTTGVKKLLRIARAEANALTEDLADIEKAKAATNAALEALENDIRHEEQRASTDPAFYGSDLARYIDAARERRRNLTTTRATLANAEEKTRAALEVAFVEMKKLDHLIEVHGAEIRKDARRTDREAMDELANLSGRR